MIGLRGLLLGFLVVGALGAPAMAQTTGLYAQAVYDEKRDPAADLTAAVTRAKAENKRILVEVGGEWCVWCKYLDAFLVKDAKARTAMADAFVVMKVNWSPDNKNESFLGAYPAAEGYPQFYILESDGKLLKAVETSQFEKGKSYSASKLIAFAKTWKRD